MYFNQGFLNHKQKLINKNYKYKHELIKKLSIKFIILTFMLCSLFKAPM